MVELASNELSSGEHNKRLIAYSQFWDSSCHIGCISTFKSACYKVYMHVMLNSATAICELSVRCPKTSRDKEYSNWLLVSNYSGTSRTLESTGFLSLEVTEVPDYIPEGPSQICRGFLYTVPCNDHASKGTFLPKYTTVHFDLPLVQVELSGGGKNFTRRLSSFCRVGILLARRSHNL